MAVLLQNTCEVWHKIKHKKDKNAQNVLCKLFSTLNANFVTKLVWFQTLCVAKCHDQCDKNVT
jgi:hypothetical protein